MSWTRTPLTALAVCVLLLAGTVGCGSDAARGQDGHRLSPSPVGEVLDETDSHGRHYRETAEGHVPEVGVEVQPGPDGGGGDWDVRVTLRDFRLSPAGVKPRAVAGRGLAYLFVDDRLVTRLRTFEHRLPADLVPRGTHHVTVRLYADDGTVWTMDGVDGGRRARREHGRHHGVGRQDDRDADALLRGGERTGRPAPS